ncbi:hypothetical protein KIPB_003794, partial [Kipferlia bialata]
IKLVKLYGEEEFFRARVAEERNTELKQVKAVTRYSMIFSVWMNQVSPLVALVTFGYYVWKGNELEADVVYQTITVLSYLKIFFMMVPVMVSALLTAAVATKRLDCFLSLPEPQAPVLMAPVSHLSTIPSEPVSTTDADGDDEVAVSLVGSFTWGLAKDQDIPTSLSPVEAAKAKALVAANKGIARLEAKKAKLLAAAAKSDPKGEREAVVEAVPETPAEEEKEPETVEIDAAPAAEGEEEEEDVVLTPLQKVDKELQKLRAKAIASAPPPPPEDLPACLLGLEMGIRKGALVVVGGTVGGGKTSLLNAMMGELRPATEDAGVLVHGSVAYCPQSAWIMNETIKNNILFGKPFDADRYAATIEMCALGPDLDLCPAGDRTEIGERGVTLSGGQKQRIALARAVYSDSDVYLLDDPLSAVDAHVGRVLFNQAIAHLMESGKTVVLVTHQTQYFVSPLVSAMVWVDKGAVVYQGDVEGFRSTPFGDQLPSADSYSTETSAVPSAEASVVAEEGEDAEDAEEDKEGAMPLTRKYQGDAYDEKTDIWSMGCVLYELVSGRHPFKADNMAALTHLLETASFPPLLVKKHGPLVPLIHSMLRADPEERPSASTLLASPVFRGVAPCIGSALDRARALVRQKQDIESQLSALHVRLGNVLADLSMVSTAPDADEEVAALVQQHVTSQHQGSETGPGSTSCTSIFSDDSGSFSKSPQRSPRDPHNHNPRTHRLRVPRVRGSPRAVPRAEVPMPKDYSSPGGPSKAMVLAVHECASQRGVLNLSGLMLTDADLTYLIAHIDRLGVLVTVRMGTLQSDTGASLVSEFFRSLPHPEAVRKYDDSGVMHSKTQEIDCLMGILELLPNLQSLKLADKPLAAIDGAPEALFRCMDGRASLQTLKLVRCGLGTAVQECAEYVWRMARNPPTLPSLKKLVLTHNDFCDAHVDVLKTLAAHYPTLTSLNLAHNSFSPEGQAHFADMKCVRMGTQKG